MKLKTEKRTEKHLKNDWTLKLKIEKKKFDWKLKLGSKFFCVNLCVQWLPFCNNLYIAGETTNMQDLERHSNLKG